MNDDGEILSHIVQLRTGNLVRMAAASKVLVQIGSPTVPALTEIVQNRRADWWVRCEAARTLGLIGDPQAAPALIEALKNKDKRLSGGAAEALERMGLPAVPALLIVLKGGESADPIRYAAAELLTKIGAVSDLTRLLRDKSIDRSRRFTVASVLKWYGFPVVPVLIEALTDRSVDRRVRREAAQILGSIKDPQAFPALIKALEDKDKEVSKEVAGVLDGIAWWMNYTKPFRPDPALRAALPILRRLQKRDPVYQKALQKIEVAMAAFKDLPMPAAALKNLPIPATAPILDVRALPRPADVPLGNLVAPPLGFWVRLRRRLRSS